MQAGRRALGRTALKVAAAGMVAVAGAVVSGGGKPRRALAATQDTTFTATGPGTIGFYVPPGADLGFGGRFEGKGFGLLAIGKDNGSIGISASGDTFGVMGKGKVIGVAASSDQIAVQAETATGVGVRGLTGGNAAATFPAPKHVGVHGASATPGFGTGIGVKGEATVGYGGWFKGGSAEDGSPGTAPLHIEPAGPAKGGPPPSYGQQGDLYADKVGGLWFCVAGGNPAKWKQVMLT
jgi:hypothetical protein